LESRPFVKDDVGRSGQVCYTLSMVNKMVKNREIAHCADIPYQSPCIMTIIRGGGD